MRILNGWQGEGRAGGDEMLNFGGGGILISRMYYGCKKNIFRSQNVLELLPTEPDIPIKNPKS